MFDYNDAKFMAFTFIYLELLCCNALNTPIHDALACKRWRSGDVTNSEPFIVTIGTKALHHSC